jgi:Asp/Glu/hydantoin racemase
MPRISLIHATPVSLNPVADAFANLWPEATTTNLLDDSLSADLKEAGTLDSRMTDRFLTLGRYASETGADAILFTCSAFGPSIEAVASDLRPKPVLKPNEAMFEEAAGKGARVGMLVTFQPSIAPMEAEFRAMAEASGNAISLESVLAEGAMDALLDGDADLHNRLIADAAPQLAGCDVIMLAQFSMAQARPLVETAVDVPVLTSPESAVIKLRSILTP